MFFNQKNLAATSLFLLTISLLLFFYPEDKTKVSNEKSMPVGLTFQVKQFQPDSYPFNHLAKEETFLRVDFKNKKRKSGRLFYSCTGKCIASIYSLRNSIAKAENALIKKYSPPFSIIYHRLNI